MDSNAILTNYLSLLEHNETERRKHLRLSRDLLQQATKLDPTSTLAFWHLATVQSSLRDVDAAVVSARQAVELAPNDVRAWHLLGLLLTAQEDWENALQVFELGLLKTQEELIAETDIETEALASEAGASAAGKANANGTTHAEDAEGIETHDFAQSDPTATNGATDPLASSSTSRPMRPTLSRESTAPIIGTRSDSIPSPTLLQYPIPSVPFQRTSERFEASVQMLLTQLAVSERYEGAERANERWPDVFSYFSSHCPSGPPPDASSRSGSSVLYMALETFSYISSLFYSTLVRANHNSNRDDRGSLRHSACAPH